MSHSFDGNRSRNKLALAKHHASCLREEGIPSGTTLRDGFLIHSNVIQEDFDGGWIKAPMGMVVACSLEDSMTFMVADNWAGSITSKQDEHILRQFTLPSLSFSSGVKSDESAYSAILFDSFLDISYEFATVGGLETTDSYYEVTPTSIPVLLPYKQAEGFWRGLEGIFQIDASTFSEIFEYMLHFYLSDGSSLTSRTFNKAERISSDALGWSFISLPATDFAGILTHNAEWYSIISDAKIAGTYLRFYNGAMERVHFKLLDIFDGIPTEVMQNISSVTDWTQSLPLGSYGWALAKDDYPIFFHVCDLTRVISDGFWSTFRDWFWDDITREKWLLFYTIFDGGIPYIVNSDQFMPILDTIDSQASTDPLHSHFALNQLLPRPNAHGYVPHDSAMFHAEDNNIYVYTRKYGMFRFDKTGIYVDTFIVPPEVSNIGTRPTITYAGNGKYLCVCENLVPPGHVYAVYYGSPFVGWTMLPGVDAGFHLEYIRPVRVLDDGTTLNIILMGIMKDEATSDHYVAHLNYSGTEAWNKMTKLPVIDAVRMNWDVCLFGSGEYVKFLSDYLDPPNVMGRMPVCSTYSDYDQP